ncbi:serine/threonine-protein kinase bur1 [Fonsecaea monophora]|uniref:Serine/threonine-protein kinase BUR1 n=1 Tax=Fonsecaea monophora TaxID=254056 RepID=A0A177ERG3_9EURO|nr:serine/threonine-protein kinase bur1 [Fonsecaea monophora]KAH0846542.1 Cyclin-dependent kinase C-1 [Fonsecaea pedrosoi]OAG34557.1 serine/threonine-protein kinase bur1 [Fonsecaea monophora]
MSSDARHPRKSLEFLEDGRPRFHGCSRITEYEYMGKLGEGTFGEVSKAKSKRTGQIVALKKILMHNEKDGFPITALREIKLLKQLDHINVLKLAEMAVERPKNASKKTSMFMVTPYMDHDLSGLLENPDVNFTTPQIKCYMKQLLEGCAYLHENRILHRDMKTANLLINNRGILQIADFGLARPYDDEPPKPGQGGGEATREYTTLVVTRWYRPPELLLQLRKYTTAIDMWGVGCVFGEMFKHKPILTGDSDLNQARLIFELLGSPTEENMPGWRELPGADAILEFEQMPPTLTRQFRDLEPLALSLLSELLKLDWRKRINAIDALKHPYFHSAPYPARPEELPSFEESHELDRKKFRDQRTKRPPAPAGGSVGIGPQGEWGISGRPLPPYEGMRGGGGPPPGARAPGGRPPYANGHNTNQPYNRRPPGPPQNGAYGGGGDYRGANPYPPHRDMPPYDQGHRPPYDDSYPRRPPGDHTMPPRLPPTEVDSYRHGPPEVPPYRDDGRGPPLPRSRAPPATGGGAGGPAGGGNRDTYIPPYSSADPHAAPPKHRRRDDRPGYRDGPPDYGEPIRYEEPSGREPADRDRDRERRPRSRSPGRDWERERDGHRDRRDRDRDMGRDYRERDRDRGGYGGQDPYRR